MNAREWWTSVQRALAAAHDPGSDEAMRLRRAASAIEDMQRLHGLGCPVPAEAGRGALVRLDPWYRVEEVSDDS